MGEFTRLTGKRGIVIVISGFLKRYLKAKRTRCTSLFTRAAKNQRGVSRRVVKRS